MKQKRRKLFTGYVQKNRSGFSFIIPDEKHLPDAYVNRKQSSGLIDRDRVEFEYSRKGRRTAAEITRILERSQTHVVGKVDKVGKRFVILSSDMEWELVHKATIRPETGHWVVAKVVEYPRSRIPGKARIEEDLGPTLLPKHDYPITVVRFNLRDDFSPSITKEARECRRLAKDSKPSSSRKDLRKIPLVTIDGADAKDFDDAVAVVCPSKGPAYVLYVCIADVSHFVRKGTQLDEAARERSTSVYFPDRCLPMLPEVLSNDLCSLLPQKDRLAVTAEIHYDRKGTVIARKFYESTIKTAARITYDDLQGFFDNKAELGERFKSIRVSLKNMLSLFQQLRKKRQTRGVLDFELPECEIHIDGTGRPTYMGQSTRHDSHRLIEEFMIAANTEVAKALTHGDIPSLHRVHEPPNPDSVDEINTVLRSLGTDKRLTEVSPRAFSEVLLATASQKSVRAVHSILLRNQKQAHYTPSPSGHFGLALRHYTHFTSPIRRYPDLVVHRALKRLIGNSSGSDKYKEEQAFLVRAATTSSAQERKATEAENFAKRRKACWYLQPYQGHTFPGRITWIRKEGLSVELSGFAQEGFVPLDSLDGYYVFDESRLRLVKRPGQQKLRIGDLLTVRIQEVSVAEGKIELRLQKEK